MQSAILHFADLQANASAAAAALRGPSWETAGSAGAARLWGPVWIATGATVRVTRALEHFDGSSYGSTCRRQSIEKTKTGVRQLFSDLVPAVELRLEVRSGSRFVDVSARVESPNVERAESGIKAK